VARPSCPILETVPNFGSVLNSLKVAVEMGFANFVEERVFDLEETPRTICCTDLSDLVTSLIVGTDTSLRIRIFTWLSFTECSR
jgi:hypothetical protein